MPLLRLKQAVAGAKPGDVISITVTDEHAELDFATWCERFGHALTKTEDDGAVMVFCVTVVTRSETPDPNKGVR